MMNLLYISSLLACDPKRAPFLLTCHVMSLLCPFIHIPILIKKTTVDGESMIKEEGFTLQKYEELFFDTIEEDELQEWAEKLPDHPKVPAQKKKKKKKNRVSISPEDDSSSEGGDDDDEEEDYELIGAVRKFTCHVCVYFVCIVRLESKAARFILLILYILWILTKNKFICVFRYYTIHSSSLQNEGHI